MYRNNLKLPEAMPSSRLTVTNRCLTYDMGLKKNLKTVEHGRMSSNNLIVRRNEGIASGNLVDFIVILSARPPSNSNR